MSISEDYKQTINNVNSNMCRGCNKIAVSDNKIRCWYTYNEIGFWNDLINLWQCDYKRNLEE